MYVKVKIKVHTGTGHKGPDGGTGVALIFLQLRRKVRWAFNATTRSLYLRENDTVPII
jgi:hypothetical protein